MASGQRTFSVLGWCNRVRRYGAARPEYLRNHIRTENRYAASKAKLVYSMATTDVMEMTGTYRLTMQSNVASFERRP